MKQHIAATATSDRSTTGGGRGIAAAQQQQSSSTAAAQQQHSSSSSTAAAHPQTTGATGTTGGEGTMGSIFVCLSPTSPVEARNLGRFGSPKWYQKGTQNEPKSKTKTKTKKEAFQDRLGGLGAILERSRDPSWVNKVCFSLGFFNAF